MVEICREVRRVLRDDGVFWLNYGDCYYNHRPGGSGLTKQTLAKNDREQPVDYSARRDIKQDIGSGSLMMMPHRVALALQADGWIVRQAITWIKGSPMPESVNGWRFQQSKKEVGRKDANWQERPKGWQAGLGGHDVGPDSKGQYRNDEAQTVAEYEYGDDYELRRSSWRPSSATEMVFMLTKKMQYWGDAQSTRILSKRLNRFDSISENGREMGGGLWSSVPAEGSDVSLNYHLAPYWIFACLFGLERVLIEQGDDLFRKIIQAAQTPVGTRIGSRICTAIAEYASSELLLKLLENINIIVSQSDLNKGSVLMVSAPHSMPDDERALAIKETCKMAPEIIANVEAIRDALTINTPSKGIIDVDMIERAIPFRDCLIPLLGDFGDFKIPQSIIEELDLLLGEIGFEEASGPSHSGDYTTTINGEGHNLWNWWFINTEAYPAAHYATFPRALVEPCILATCPRWACPVCGQGWAAVVEKGEITSKGGSAKPDRGKLEVSEHLVRLRADGSNASQFAQEFVARENKTLGYRPTCEHQEEAVPGIVFDPFVGSGTTIAVAKQLLRRGIGIDISMEYLDKQAKVRAGLGSPSSALDDLPLFK